MGAIKKKTKLEVIFCETPLVGKNVKRTKQAKNTKAVKISSL
jgi:hypothetical protein